MTDFEAGPEEGASWGEQISLLLGNSRNIIADCITLFKLRVALLQDCLLQISIFVIFSFIFIGSAWTLTIWEITLGLIHLGIRLPIALAIDIGINLLLLIISGLSLRHFLKIALADYSSSNEQEDVQ